MCAFFFFFFNMNCSYIWLKVNFSWFLLIDSFLPCCLLSPERKNWDSSYKVFTLNNHNSSPGKLSPQEPQAGLSRGSSARHQGPVLLCSPRSLRTVSTFESRHLQQTWRLASRVQEDFSLLLTTAPVMWPGLGRGGELGLSDY